MGGTPKVVAPPPVPQIDDAVQRQRERDRMARRGRATTILTSENGLPDLGTTTTPQAY